MQSPLPAFPGTLGPEKPPLPFFELLDSLRSLWKGGARRRVYQGKGASERVRDHGILSLSATSLLCRENSEDSCRGEMKSQGASTAGGEPVEGDGTPPTPVGRAEAGTGGVSRGPPLGLAAVQGSSSLGVQVPLAIYNLMTGGRDMLCFLICELNCEMQPLCLFRNFLFC